MFHYVWTCLGPTKSLALRDTCAGKIFLQLGQTFSGLATPFFVIQASVATISRIGWTSKHPSVIYGAMSVPIQGHGGCPAGSRIQGQVALISVLPHISRPLKSEHGSWSCSGYESCSKARYTLVKLQNCSYRWDYFGEKLDRLGTALHQRLVVRRPVLRHGGAMRSIVFNKN